MIVESRQDVVSHWDSLDNGNRFFNVKKLNVSPVIDHKALPVVRTMKDRKRLSAAIPTTRDHVVLIDIAQISLLCF